MSRGLMTRLANAHCCRWLPRTIDWVFPRSAHILVYCGPYFISLFPKTPRRASKRNEAVSSPALEPLSWQPIADKNVDYNGIYNILGLADRQLNPKQTTGLINAVPKRSFHTCRNRSKIFWFMFKIQSAFHVNWSCWMIPV